MHWPESTDCGRSLIRSDDRDLGEGSGANMDDEKLSLSIAMELSRLESEGEIVVTCPSVEPLADRIASKVLEIVPNTGLSQIELLGVRSLILHAVSDKKFFDWEMPTLTGFSAEEFSRIAEKLPRD